MATTAIMSIMPLASDTNDMGSKTSSACHPGPLANHSGVGGGLPSPVLPLPMGTLFSVLLSESRDHPPISLGFAQPGNTGGTVNDTQMASAGRARADIQQQQTSGLNSGSRSIRTTSQNATASSSHNATVSSSHNIYQWLDLSSPGTSLLMRIALHLALVILPMPYPKENMDEDLFKESLTFKFSMLDMAAMINWS
ncbi:hypothetical protein M413DRAFT_21274 [Hebeloma cylindrosporum]|uniref:Uncharacterized protein n=1 Tax=Hebeloma cylindrosporum TaxID=76867 RepID=A0A0C2YGZ6_HEBCY|nr:hypothetical protein M413DRAFT_21274 [Hebeloma cylindrosporum h7]